MKYNRFTRRHSPDAPRVTLHFRLSFESRSFHEILFSSIEDETKEEEATEKEEAKEESEEVKAAEEPAKEEEGGASEEWTTKTAIFSAKLSSFTSVIYKKLEVAVKTWPPLFAYIFGTTFELHTYMRMGPIIMSEPPQKPQTKLSSSNNYSENEDTFTNFVLLYNSANKLI